MSELVQLLEKEIPDGRENLQENFNNLERVAQFCQENYLQAADKKEALEQTKNYTTHSLASVAYQINNLATNFLKLLDLQQSHMAEMESNVNHLSETVQIHKEKVARCEIGVLTTQRTTTRPLGVKNGIIFPEHGERPTKYQRKTIDYSTLDDIGHGVKSQTPAASQQQQKSSRSSSISSTGTTPAPNQRPPTPPQLRQGGSLGRAAGQQQASNYRTPAPAVAPPTVPSHYASMQQQQQMMREQQRTSGAYAPGNPTVMGITHLPPGMMRDSMGMGPQPGSMGMGQMGVIRTPGGTGQMPAGQMGPPPVGMARPMTHSQGGVGRVSAQLPEGAMPGQGMAGMPGGRISQSQGVVGRVSAQVPEGAIITMPGQGIVGVPGGRISQMPKQTSIENLPPPPMSPDNVGNENDNKNISFDEASPPPPPPPQFDDEADNYPDQQQHYPEQQQHYPDQQQLAEEEDPYAAAGPDFMSNKWVPEHYLEKVIAIYDYVADKEDELSFSENSVVYVIKKNDDGWWEGTLNGQTGLFPGNYVEPCM